MEEFWFDRGCIFVYFVWRNFRILVLHKKKPEIKKQKWIFVPNQKEQIKMNFGIFQSLYIFVLSF